MKNIFIEKKSVYQLIIYICYILKREITLVRFAYRNRRVNHSMISARKERDDFFSRIIFRFINKHDVNIAKV